MPREIKMPKLSDTMEEGTINVWRKREGDPVRKGEVLLEVETDKADMEYEAYVAGTLVRILVAEGETVNVGTPIAVVRLESDSDEDVDRFLAGRSESVAVGPPPATPSPTAPEPVARVPEPSTPPPPAPFVPSPAASGAARSSSEIPFFLPDPERVRATPRARTLAKERAVDLSEIAGTGPDGAVLVGDIERYLEELDAQQQPLLQGDALVTPVAARIAEELNVDLTLVKGTGPGGRITKRDVRDHLEREAQARPLREAELFGDEIKLSQKRKALVRNMVESKREVPHFYVSVDVNAEPLRALRERLRADDRHVTYTHLILKASALALERHPEVNATFRDERIIRFNPINVALAVDVQGELVAPVVKDCQGRDVEDLARAADALIRKAREKKLRPEDYSEGTFTISNLGMFGIDHFYAIITPPQSTVLSVGSVRSVPVFADGAVRVGRRVMFGLGVDHRVLDGVKAAQFLAELRDLLENPEPLLVSGAAHGA